MMPLSEMPSAEEVKARAEYRLAQADRQRAAIKDDLKREIERATASVRALQRGAAAKSPDGFRL
jgi:hypothetical protein